RGHRPHLLRCGLLGLAQRVVHRRDDQVLEHVLVVGEQTRIDRDALDVVAAGDGHLDEPGARLALDLDLRKLLLHPLHVLLHLLGLLHQSRELLLHHSPSPEVGARSPIGRTDPGTIAPPNSSISVRTNGSVSIDACARAWRSARARSEAAATVADPTRPSSTSRRTGAPKCAPSASRTRLTVDGSASSRTGTRTRKRSPSASISSLWCMNCCTKPPTRSCAASAGQSPSNVARGAVAAAEVAAEVAADDAPPACTRRESCGAVRVAVVLLREAMTACSAAGPAGAARGACPPASAARPAGSRATAAPSSGRNASRRNNTIVKPAWASGASGRSCAPWITIWYQTCRSSGATDAASRRSVSGSSASPTAPTCASAIRCSSAARSASVRSNGALPLSISSASATSAGPSPATSASRMRTSQAASTTPSISRTAGSRTSPPPNAIAWSSSDSASRMLPPAARPIRSRAPRSCSTPSAASTVARCVATAAGGMFFRLNCRQRESTVTGTRCGSVVASTNTTCGGGSSSVLSIALNACVDSMWTSSITYTL